MMGGAFAHGNFTNINHKNNHQYEKNVVVWLSDNGLDFLL